jgi:hypothetical protein
MTEPEFRLFIFAQKDAVPSTRKYQLTIVKKKQRGIQFEILSDHEKQEFS